MPDSLQLVVFTLDEQRYALQLSVVERTARMVEITAVPAAPEIVLGVINVCGVVLPVLNIRKRFRLREREPGLGDQLIIARTVRRTVAVVADMVCDVLVLPEGERVEPGTILPGLEYVQGVVKLDNGMVFIHDLDAFLSLEEEQALDTVLESNTKGNHASPDI